MAAAAGFLEIRKRTQIQHVDTPITASIMPPPHQPVLPFQQAIVDQILVAENCLLVLGAGLGRSQLVAAYLKELSKKNPHGLVFLLNLAVEEALQLEAVLETEGDRSPRVSDGMRFCVFTSSAEAGGRGESPRSVRESVLVRIGYDGTTSRETEGPGDGIGTPPEAGGVPTKTKSNKYYAGPSEREGAYGRGGVFAVSSRMLATDFLGKRFSPEKVTKLILFHAEQVREVAHPAGFLAHAIVRRLPPQIADFTPMTGADTSAASTGGAIVAISNDFVKLERAGFDRVMHACGFLRKAFLWPRIHHRVEESLKGGGGAPPTGSVEGSAGVGAAAVGGAAAGLGDGTSSGVGDSSSIRQTRVPLAPKVAQLQKALVTLAEDLLAQLSDVSSQCRDLLEAASSVGGVSLMQQEHAASASAKNHSSVLAPAAKMGRPPFKGGTPGASKAKGATSSDVLQQLASQAMFPGFGSALRQILDPFFLNNARELKWADAERKRKNCLAEVEELLKDLGEMPGLFSSLGRLDCVGFWELLCDALPSGQEEVEDNSAGGALVRVRGLARSRIFGAAGSLALEVPGLWRALLEVLKKIGSSAHVGGAVGGAGAPTGATTTGTAAVKVGGDPKVIELEDSSDEEAMKTPDAKRRKIAGPKAKAVAATAKLAAPKAKAGVSAADPQTVVPNNTGSGSVRTVVIPCGSERQQQQLASVLEKGALGTVLESYIAFATQKDLLVASPEGFVHAAVVKKGGQSQSSSANPGGPAMLSAAQQEVPPVAKAPSTGPAASPPRARAGAVASASSSRTPVPRAGGPGSLKNSLMPPTFPNSKKKPPPSKKMTPARAQHRGNKTRRKLDPSFAAHVEQARAMLVETDTTPLCTRSDLLHVHLVLVASLEAALRRLRPNHIVLLEPDLQTLRNVEVFSARARARVLGAPQVHLLSAPADTSLEHFFYQRHLGDEAQAVQRTAAAKKAHLADIGKLHGRPFKLYEDTEHAELIANTRIGGGTLAQKRKMATASSIVVDLREFNAKLPWFLYQRHSLIPWTIAVGDYVLSRDIAVERKGVLDLAHSLQSGRLARQCASLIKCYNNPAVLLEFEGARRFLTWGTSAATTSFNGARTSDQFVLSGSRLSSAELRGRLLGLVLWFGVKLKLLWSPSLAGTAKLFTRLKKNRLEPSVVGGEQKSSGNLGEQSRVNSRAVEALRRLPGISGTNVLSVAAGLGDSGIVGLVSMSRAEVVALLGGEQEGEELYAYLHGAEANRTLSFVEEDPVF